MSQLRISPEHALADLEIAGDVLADAVSRELELEALKPLRKSEAIRRLIGSENPETGKPHSASSAEKIVEADPEFWEFERQRREAVVTKIRAQLVIETHVERRGVA